MSVILFLVAVWLWVCLVHFSDRPFQCALFIVPMTVLAVISETFKWLFYKSMALVHSTGDW